jgi:hypothetical protein
MYQVWASMRYRCNSPSCKAYPKYGGRGITISPEWDTFKGFYEWAIHNGYEDNLTLDRIDNDGNYEPSNCQWITIGDQQKNRSYNYDVVINGEQKSLAEWCEIYEINYYTVVTRMNCYGYEDIVTAITTPLKRKGGNGRTKRKII